MRARWLAAIFWLWLGGEAAIADAPARNAAAATPAAVTKPAGRTLPAPKVTPPPTSRWDLAGKKDAIGAAQSLVTIAAIFLGGLWGYFKFLSGRVYTSRLEIGITGELHEQGAFPHFTARMSVKNVGLTRVYIDQEFSSIEVKAFKEIDYYPAFHTPDLTTLGVIPALTNHAWIEPGECVTEDRLLALPPETILSIRLQFRLLERPTRLKPRNRCIEWNAIAVLPPEGVKPV